MNKKNLSIFHFSHFPLFPLSIFHENLFFSLCRHPDKSSDPSAESKFVEIKQAYELLVDPDRRKLFDQHGITNEDANYHKRPDYSQYGRFATDPFEDLFG